MRENLSAARAAELLMQKDNITLLCHRRPDGDTVGSAFALYYALKELGKEVRVLCADALPKQYDYLYGDYTPSRVLDWPVEYVVTVDVATAGMLGGLEEKYGHMVDLCIDHHPSNSDYAAQTCLWPAGSAFPIPRPGRCGWLRKSWKAAWIPPPSIPVFLKAKARPKCWPKPK